jgi:hypothetical protein
MLRSKQSKVVVGIEVAAVVSGRGEESAPIAILGGVLASHHGVEPIDALPTDLRGESATTFRIGDHWRNVISREQTTRSCFG